MSNSFFVLLNCRVDIMASIPLDMSLLDSILLVITLQEQCQGPTQEHLMVNQGMLRHQGVTIQLLHTGLIHHQIQDILSQVMMR